MNNRTQRKISDIIDDVNSLISPCEGDLRRFVHEAYAHFGIDGITTLVAALVSDRDHLLSSLESNQEIYEGRK